jgi:hypothetical protein
MKDVQEMVHKMAQQKECEKIGLEARMVWCH